jgi:hypothetical protein
MQKLWACCNPLSDADNDRIDQNKRLKGQYTAVSYALMDISKSVHGLYRLVECSQKRR